jgi:uncharacterized protein with ParB-like and HNH nuclease domain
MGQNDKFTAESQTVLELFQSGIYEVPAFQRDFAWTKEQCQDLWTDIGTLLEHSDQSHFLGPMVVIKEEHTGSSSTSVYSTKYLVIDGQQRLTTLQIILSLIRDRWIAIGGTRVTDAGNKPYSEVCDALINKGSPSYSLTFLPNIYIRESFKEYIQKSKTDESPRLESFSDLPESVDRSHSEELFAAYFYFKKEINKLNKEDLLNLETKLLSEIFVLKIDAGKIGNAFILFDTLNNRGLDLTQGDLLKNFIFKKTDPNASSVLSLELSNRLAKWDNIVETVGYKKLDSFLRYFLILRKKTKVQRETIITDIEKMYDSKEKVAVLISELEEDANRFSLIERDSVFDGRNADALNLLFNDLSDLDQSTQSIFLMAALKRFSDHGQSEVFKNLSVLVRSAEILSFRWLICAKNAQDLENIWIEAVKSLADSSLSDDDAVKKVREKFKNELPDDKEFQSEFDSKVIKSSKFARYILKKIEHSRMGTATWVLAGSSVLDVEHIAPKNPDDRYDWKEVMKGPNTYKTIVYRIGNQILLSQGPNRAAKNHAFSKKLEYYKEKEGTDLPIVSKPILEERSWTQAKVDSRSKKLAMEAVTVWGWNTTTQDLTIRPTQRRKRAARKKTTAKKAVAKKSTTKKSASRSRTNQGTIH